MESSSYPVRPLTYHIQKPRTTLAEESRQGNPRLNTEPAFHCQTFRCQYRLGNQERSALTINSLMAASDRALPVRDKAERGIFIISPLPKAALRLGYYLSPLRAFR